MSFFRLETIPRLMGSINMITARLKRYNTKLYAI